MVSYIGIINNILSSSIILTYLIPLFLLYITKSIVHLEAFIGLIGVNIISEYIKRYIVGYNNVRPIGATDCDLFCLDGNQSGQPGMPSSHSASVAFFSAFYFQKTKNIYVKILLVIYSSLVMLSRYFKKCHTIEQIMVGGILGIGLSLIYIVILRYLIENKTVR